MRNHFVVLVALWTLWRLKSDNSSAARCCRCSCCCCCTLSWCSKLAVCFLSPVSTLEAHRQPPNKLISMQNTLSGSRQHCRSTRVCGTGQTEWDTNWIMHPTPWEQATEGRAIVFATYKTFQMEIFRTKATHPSCKYWQPSPSLMPIISAQNINRAQRQHRQQQQQQQQTGEKERKIEAGTVACRMGAVY